MSDEGDRCIGTSQQQGDAGAEAEGKRHRPPPAIAEHADEPARVTSREQALDELLTRVDHHQRRGDCQGEDEERRSPLRPVIAAAGPGEPREQFRGGECRRQDEHWREGGQVRMTLGSQFMTRVSAEGELVAQLVNAQG